MNANGIEIGSHTVSHVDLTQASPEELRRQLEDSKASLEGLLRHPVLDFCYPSSAVNPTVVQAVEAAGYQSATSTAQGTLHSASDRYLWPRARVSGGETLTEFAVGLGQEEPSEPRPPSTEVPTLPTAPPPRPPQGSQVASVTQRGPIAKAPTPRVR